MSDQPTSQDVTSQTITIDEWIASLPQRRAALIKQRDQFVQERVQEINMEVARINGQIDEIDTTLAKIKLLPDQKAP